MGTFSFRLPRASLASHMNTSIFLQRKEWRGEISETEPAPLTVACVAGGISCASAFVLAGKENKRQLQTLSIDNAWSNKNFLVYLAFRMLQHTSSEVNGYNCYKHLKIQK